MTIDDIKAMEKPTLSPAEVCAVMGGNPHTLSLTARQYPERIKFPYYFSGRWMRVPRVAFVAFVEGGHAKW